MPEDAKSAQLLTNAVTANDKKDETTTTVEKPEISVVKKANGAADTSSVAAGDIITYTVEITNLSLIHI